MPPGEPRPTRAAVRQIGSSFECSSAVAERSGVRRFGGLAPLQQTIPAPSGPGPITCRPMLCVARAARRTSPWLRFMIPT